MSAPISKITAREGGSFTGSHFRFYKKQDLLNITKLRRYETKLGERIQVVNPNDLVNSLQQSTAPFVLLGIPEDIGVRANFGTGGTETAWLSFLQAFCNVQSTDLFTGEEVIALGHFDFNEVKGLIEAHARNMDETIDACRHAVANVIDPEVEEMIKLVTALGKTPIVIGGGHNNAYPLIKGTAKGLQKAGMMNNSQINAINLDAHADFRIMEGRHSGNGFRYAKEEGYLNKYAIVGLHENYNSQSMMDDLYSNINIQYSTFEDIFVREKLNFRQAIAQAVSFTEDSFVGVELDLDCVERILSSAISPSGITPLLARQFLAFLANDSQVVYLHICEGAAQSANGNFDPLTGKFISYLVSDFIKAHID
ncbi:MAG: arginase [Bacteroidetes bacterium]|nr:MAG: arginase [Bacteroidota bacterium]